MWRRLKRRNPKAETRKVAGQGKVIALQKLIRLYLDAMPFNFPNILKSTEKFYTFKEDPVRFRNKFHNVWIGVELAI